MKNKRSRRYNPPMLGTRLQDVFGQLDPRLTFVSRAGRVARCGDLSRATRIPDTDHGHIYAFYEDANGYVYIGIAQSGDESPLTAAEWQAEQIATPLFRSRERVDVMGQILPRDIEL